MRATASSEKPESETANASIIAGPVSYAETYYPRFHYGWSELFSVETAQWKFVKAPRPELYDLAADPKQTHDVTAQHPGIAASLSAQLDANEP